MKISHWLRNVILTELFIPITLLIVGIYHGLMQTVYRAGLIHQSSFAGLDYYQGLTLHGVINALVLTTFFAVAFGHATIAYFLKHEPRKQPTKISMWLMIAGTAMAAWAMFAGKADVLYTFYPPLKAHPLFYLGLAVMIVGSWIPLFDWVGLLKSWRASHTGEKVPLAVWGTIINFIIWFTCTLSVAYEVLFMLLPWSLGWKATINVALARTLFWFFGHALVYFWLLPAYVMYYAFLPRLAGGKLYSDLVGRITFAIFLIFSVPVGVHHQFSDPSIEPNTKLTQSLLTFGVALPSFLTAFTMFATLEYAGRKNGGKGLFGWIGRLPFFDSSRYLFSYFICGLILFIFGGFTGIVNASYELNAVVHNTAFLPGHFHMTVAGPVILAILGMSVHLVSQLKGKKVFAPALNTIVPYLWMIGVFIFSAGLMWGGLQGEPRRTNLGLSYLNPKSDLFHPQWVPDTLLTMCGGFIMFLAGIFFFIVFFGTFFRRKTQEADQLEFPVSEALHDERIIPLFNDLRPWVILMVLVILIAYIPAILDVFRFAGPGAPPHLPNSPVPGL
jgi:cytochrome c oxidase subunit 1